MISVYLCIKEKNNNNFKCKSFENFLEANKYFRENYKLSDVNESTLIPICNFNPFKKYFLQYRLSKIFNKVYIN